MKRNTIQIKTGQTRFVQQPTEILTTIDEEEKLDESGQKAPEIVATMNNYQVQVSIQEALASLGDDYSDLYENKKFNHVDKVCDLLLSDKPVKQSYQEILILKGSLDRAIKVLSENRHSEFNDIIYAIEPVEDQLNHLQEFVQELQKSSDTIRRELEQKNGNLIPLLHTDEFSSEYYSQVVQGLQIFEKIARHSEEIDFL